MLDIAILVPNTITKIVISEIDSIYLHLCLHVQRQLYKHLEAFHRASIAAIYTW